VTRVVARGADGGWHAMAMSGIDKDDVQALLGPPATPAQRRRQQASQARFDHAVGLVERAAKAASSCDQQALDAAVACMEQMAFDDFERRHPPSAALDYLLYEVVCDLVPDVDEAHFGQTWVDHLVAHADHDLAPAVARWVRLAVGLASDEYQLSNAEQEAIDRIRGAIRPDGDSYLSPGLLRWISAHGRSCYAMAFRPWSGSGPTPEASNPPWLGGYAVVFPLSDDCAL
jgi:hypothetical protein